VLSYIVNEMMMTSDGGDGVMTFKLGLYRKLCTTGDEERYIEAR